MAPSGDSRFAVTHWTAVLSAARGHDTPHSAAAMAELCRDYWYPLYAFIRRRGYRAEQAEDLTQEFFARLLAKEFLTGVDRERGRFRTFLLMAVKRFLANERDRAQAQKRGGGQKVVPLDALESESRYRLEPSHTLTAERLFEQQWAVTLLDKVLARLQAEMTCAGKAALFDALKSGLGGSKNETYAATAASLGMTDVAVRVAAHRLRQRYRELLRQQIADTVSDPAEIDDEIHDLFGCF